MFKEMMAAMLEPNGVLTRSGSRERAGKMSFGK
jgi:hypothetical protein